MVVVPFLVVWGNSVLLDVGGLLLLSSVGILTILSSG